MIFVAYIGLYALKWMLCVLRHDHVFLLFSPVYDAWTNVILCCYLLRVANFDGRMPFLAACHCIIFNVRPGYSFMLVLLGE